MTYERISACCGAPIDDFGYCTDCKEHASANNQVRGYDGLTGEERVARIDCIIGEIKRSQQQPNWKPQTSNQMRHRAERRRDMATSVKLIGGRLTPEYE